MGRWGGGAWGGDVRSDEFDRRGGRGGGGASSLCTQAHTHTHTHTHKHKHTYTHTHMAKEIGTIATNAFAQAHAHTW